MNSRDYRALARQALKGKWRHMYGLLLVSMLISYDFFLDTIWQEFFSRPVTFLDETRLIPAGFGWLLAALALACTAVGYTVMIGRYAASQALLDGQTPALRQLFPMQYFWKALLMTIVMYILVFLQFLLLIIPGMIALFAYSMAFYLMMENPQLGPIQALKESRRLMKGHKFDFFCLTLSFIGWILLQVVLGNLVARIGSGISPAAGTLMRSACYVLVMPPLSAYTDVARTAFFRDVLYGKARKKK